MKKVTSIFSILLLFCAHVYSQWTLVGNIPQPVSYPSISVCAPDIAWIATGTTNQGKIWRTTNGGVNWTLLTAPPGPEPYSIWAIDVNTAFIGDGGSGGGGGGNAKVFKTTDGGNTWTNILMTNGNSGFINGIVFSRTMPSFGIVQSDPPNGTGQPYWIAVTTNGGDNWTVTNPPGISGAASAQNSIVVIDDQFYGFGLNAAPPRIYFTSNGGTNWTLATLGLAGAFVSGFAVSSGKNYGIAASSTSLPNISRSTNGCVSWSLLHTGAGVTGYCHLIWIHGTPICYLSSGAGAAGCIKRSSDNGATWTQMTTQGVVGGASQHLGYFKEANNVIHLYMVATTNGGVIMYRDSSLLIGINGNTGSIPAEYRLEQNYPNPFNPTTTIEYALPKASFVTIKVYDMLGSEVMEVVNEQKPAGNYNASVDASNLASGVYFYTINAGGFIDTKKMVFLK